MLQSQRDAHLKVQQGTRVHSLCFLEFLYYVTARWQVLYALDPKAFILQFERIGVSIQESSCSHHIDQPQYCLKDASSLSVKTRGA